MKIGRNDPCPCGSGKKYKKCCGAKDDFPDLSLPDELKTNTRLDDYMQLIGMLHVYYQGLLEFDDDRRELKKIARAFEKDFLPGVYGIEDSIYMSWLLFDLRFGKSRKTVCERFIESMSQRGLPDYAHLLLKQMSDSYCALYQVGDAGADWIGFVELGTGVAWKAHRYPEDVEDVTKGDIWYLRLVGPVDDAFMLTDPYMFPSMAKEHLCKAVDIQIEETRKTLEGPFDAGRLFRESWKLLLPEWADFILYTNDNIDREIDDRSSVERLMPAIFNTDGEMMRFCKIVFRVHDEEKARACLNSIKGFDYDRKHKTWIWFKKGNKQISAFCSTSLGTLKFSRGRLIAETNSEERAERLVKKLKKELKEAAVFEKMEAKDFNELPHLSKREKTHIEKEYEELMETPEMRTMARKMTEDYYHKDWLVNPMPALAGQSPLEAVKTPDGKRKVEILLNELETMQNKSHDESFRVDIQGLRTRLGL